MLTYNLEERGKLPIYEYIYRKIKDDIVSERIKPGEKLPSKRGLAQNLKVSVITVENAYAQLALEGYIYSKEKRGYFVNKIRITPKYELKKRDLSFKDNIKEEILLDISTNSVDSEKFPFSVWSKLMRNVLLEEDDRLLKKMPNIGIKKLRSAIAEHLYHFKGMEVNEENIIIGAGTDYLYNILIQLLGQDKTYAIENPGHKNIAKIYKSNRVKYNYIKLDNEGMSAEALRKSDSEVVHISPSHHYPTGITMSIGRRYEILSWAMEKEERYIIEDDYDSEFRFTGRPIPSLESISSGEKVIYINTFSKTIAPSIRISYMVLPEKLMEEYNKRLGFYSCSVSAFEQYTLAKFIEEGYFEKHINRMKNYYKNQRDYVIECINSAGLNDFAQISEKDSGLHFLLYINTKLSDREIKEMLRRLGINALMLSDYFNGEQNEDTHVIIINYSGINREDFKKAVERVKIFVENNQVKE